MKGIDKMKPWKLVGLMMAAMIYGLTLAIAISRMRTRDAEIQRLEEQCARYEVGFEPISQGLLQIGRDLDRLAERADSATATAEVFKAGLEMNDDDDRQQLILKLQKLKDEMESMDLSGVNPVRE